MTMTIKTIYRTLILTGVLSAAVAAWAVDKPQEAGAKPQRKPYLLKTCIVSGEKLGEMGEPYVHQTKDREIKFCCKGCLKDFNKDTAGYLKKLEQAETKLAATKPYPLTTCLVSGEKLGEMGDPYVHTYKDREIKLCCKGCLKDFSADPAKHVAKLEAAEKKTR